MFDLDLYALKYFFDTVEMQSMTDAAAANFVSRSAISQAVARLEIWAGLKLFTHEKRTVQLTLEGETFYRRMKRATKAFDHEMKANPDDDSLSVGCSASLIDTYLLPHLPKVKTLNLVTGTTQELARKLEDRTIRVAISIDGPGDTIASGHFVLASPTGRMSEQIVVTEKRPEVSALKKVLREKNYLTVESWTVAAKVARRLGCAVLLPDFLENRLKPIPVRGFSSRFNVTLQSVPRHLLSKSEIQLISTLV